MAGFWELTTESEAWNDAAPKHRNTSALSSSLLATGYWLLATGYFRQHDNQQKLKTASDPAKPPWREPGDLALAPHIAGLRLRPQGKSRRIGRQRRADWQTTRHNDQQPRILLLRRQTPVATVFRCFGRTVFR